MVQVRVSEGLLEGELVQNEYGGTFCSFKGIPYAQPPLGNLRFKAPQPMIPWQGIRKAKEFGPICPQFDIMMPNLTVSMSEDCLCLNIYTPNTKPNNLLPVMVWIHGGGFVYGSGNDLLYGPEFLVRHGVILVTFNYRLEALGFLCLDTADIPGNAGMKDQVAALKWINKNIMNFGGDPENVTIFGESAGGASVDYHLLSPMSKGLFKRAIAQSGAPACFWSQAFEPREKALLLAKQLGFQSTDDKELYEFFKRQPVENIVKLNLQITPTQKSYEIHFGVVNEKDFGQERFFYGDVADALRNKVHKGVDIMTGYTNDEWLMALAIGEPLKELIPKANFYSDFYTPKFIQIHCTIAHQIQASKKIQQFYYKDEEVSMKNIDNLLKFLSTDMFVYGIVLSAKLMSKKNKVYLYKFNCRSERNVFTSVLGFNDLAKDKTLVSHCDDLAYLFTLKQLTEKVDKNSETFKLIDKVTTLWTNFAKYGNPTPDRSLGVEWKPYTINSQDYLDISNEISSGNSPDKEEIEVWESVFKEYLPKYSPSL